MSYLLEPHFKKLQIASTFTDQWGSGTMQEKYRVATDAKIMRLPEVFDHSYKYCQQFWSLERCCV